MSSPTQARTLFDQIGGEAGVEKIVEDFYDRVLADPVLKPFFAHTPMDRLRTMQREFFAAALDGPMQYTGQQLSYVHFGRGIKADDFNRFVDLLLETLKSLKLKSETVNAIIERLNAYAPEVTRPPEDFE